jgi:hypothetical protein
LKNEVINSPEHYVLLWMEGFKRILEGDGEPLNTFLYINQNAIARRSAVTSRTPVAFQMSSRSRKR